MSIAVEVIIAYQRYRMARCAADRLTVSVLRETAPPTELRPRTLVERRAASARLSSTAWRFVAVNDSCRCFCCRRAEAGVVGLAGVACLPALMSLRRCEVGGGGGACTLRSPCDSRLMNRVRPLLLLSRPATTPACRR